MGFPYLRPQPSQTYDITDFISSGSLKSSHRAQATFPRSQGRDVVQPGLFSSMPRGSRLVKLLPLRLESVDGPPGMVCLRSRCCCLHRLSPQRGGWGKDSALPCPPSPP